MRTDFVAREVLTGLRRNVTMTIAMVLTTAISLALVGTGLLAVRTIDRTEELYSDRVEVQVALSQDVSAADADCSQSVCSGLRATLENSPLVDGVRFESQQQAYERYKQLFAGQSLADVVRPQSLPATLRVKLADQDGRGGRGAPGHDRPGRRAERDRPARGGRQAVRLPRRHPQRDVRAGPGAGRRRAAADLEHGAGLGVHPAHRGRGDAAGRRHPLVHPAAVPDRGGADRRGRRADRRRSGCWSASSCSSTSC